MSVSHLERSGFVPTKVNWEAVEVALYSSEENPRDTVAPCVFYPLCGTHHKTGENCARCGGSSIQSCLKEKTGGASKFFFQTGGWTCPPCCWQMDVQGAPMVLNENPLQEGTGSLEPNLSPLQEG